MQSTTSMSMFISFCAISSFCSCVLTSCYQKRNMPKKTSSIEKDAVIVASTATGAVTGAKTGAEIGVAMGTVLFCGVGAPVGGAIGAVVGGVAGFATGKYLADRMD
ncbi:uncharacterized protein isoform X1 [Choristoneura fumiferana]|uniref:uncharacterized protein isoform X1 n=2 Tax=Choristoneura fumiferana TaxID=7141 RepID=UPI003D157725